MSLCYRQCSYGICGSTRSANIILALFNEPQRWKPEDHQEVYRVSECGDMHASTLPERAAASRLARILLSELLEEQLGGRPILFLGIAGRTARDYIAFGTPSTPGEWHDMIHRQFVGMKMLLAVCADAWGNFIAPPLGLTQRSGLLFLACNMFGIFVDVNPIRHELTFMYGLSVPNTADRGYIHNRARHRSDRDCPDNASSHTRNCS